MMNKITINGYELPIKDYNEQRIVTFKDIDLVHGRPEGIARRNFNTNREHFIEGEDFFTIGLTTDEIRTQFGAGKNAGKTMTLITESGYLMLVKSFTDDLAWSVQRQLVKSYFKAKENKSVQIVDKAKALEVKEMNARVCMSNQLLKLANVDTLSEQYKNILVAKSAEILTGEKLLPLPKSEQKTYSAGEIAEMFGISAQKVGKIANSNSMKTTEYGEWYRDKSPRN